MSNFIEVVFENIDKKSVKPLIKLLGDRSYKIIAINCTEDIKNMKKDEISNEALNHFLELNCDASISINAEALVLEELVLPEVFIRVVKYESKYDIDFSFNSNEIENISISTFINELHECAKNLSYRYCVENVYGGMEPASDEKTRFFTGSKPGPLMP
ncbi:hypothetical protein [Endozoicomonas numazuensis]|uniref:Uncharacterized protein n=1 Tax=Endozoicomonas numazuensis TaxID=1137799 RepID=A0A081NDM4_9GAMM|nr:hypothetical protein [Endozoicomonas numazuensis]KEQ16547.1 hypothetical protein GZ78_22155 [Endozoicomonas numazuensis]